MKVTRFALAAGLTARTAGAFAPVPSATRHLSGVVGDCPSCMVRWSSSSSESGTICDVPGNVQNLRLIDQPQGGKILRDLDLTMVDGSTVNLGTQMGDGTEKLQPELAALGATGPWFVSIGNAEKLGKFLELNPAVPAANAFVDDYNLEAYTAAGLTGMDTSSKLPEGTSLKPPEMGFGGWWKYLKNVMSVSPASSKTVSSDQVMESVLRLGGTFVVKGDKVVYQWNDVIPGDTPDLQEVLEAVKNA